MNELKCKEVINICDGKRLGFVCDAEFEIPCGKMLSIIVPGDTRLFGFGRCDEFRIPWDCIDKIGDDIILVNGGDLCPRERPQKRKCK